ncbi:YsnF/AvaK domain-containing protein [Falsiroseomonas oryziterrae]|uniref:YsnF/AvaK domain-containing protein n=1 Tax=Falsiroseomonas oryziterrae TaxID=2911368 RepID=UPI00355723FE
MLLRRLVVTEEIRFRLRTEEEAVTLPAKVRRQEVSVERASGDNMSGESFMQRTITALFDSRAEAERAAAALQGLNVRATDVHVQDASSAGAVGSMNQDDDRLNTSTIGSMWMPEEDRATYHEGIRRGGAMVVAQVDEDGVDLAMDAMEAAGAVDLDQREAEWRSLGWTGASMAGVATGDAPDGTRDNPPGTMMSRGVDQVAGTNISGAHPESEAGRNQAGRKAQAGSAGLEGGERSIPLAEERLRVGKRVAQAGRVRVRSYVVETPVEERVRLREERVRVERRPADSPGIAGEDLFRERVIEAEETIEEAVVDKEARVTGEVIVNKDATERTETVRDTVRRTEVQVDEDKVANDPKKRRGKGVA